MLDVDDVHLSPEVASGASRRGASFVWQGQRNSSRHWPAWVFKEIWSSKIPKHPLVRHMVAI